MSWRVTSGGGTLSRPISEIDDQGRAAVTVVTDTVAGLMGVEATAAGLDPVEFSAMALPGPPSRIIISPFPFSFQVGETRQLDITVLDRYGSEITPVDPDLLSSDPDVATVGLGVVHAVGEGTATITAMYAAIRGSTTVSVVAPPP